MTPDPTLVVHVRVVGVLMALLVVVNLFVPGRCNWELSRVSLLNRQIYVTAVCGLALRAIS